MSRFFSSKNVVIMICRSGRHRSVANAELWSNTLTRCSKRQHTLFPCCTCLSWISGKHVCRKLFGMQQTVSEVTGRWKRPRPERTEDPALPTKDQLQEEDHPPQNPKERATSTATTPAKTCTTREILDELAERPGNFHDNARSPAGCLQNRSVFRATDQRMIERVCFTNYWEKQETISNECRRNHKKVYVLRNPVLARRHRR